MVTRIINMFYRTLYLIYRGTAPVKLDPSNSYVGPLVFKTNNPSIEMTMMMSTFLEGKVGPDSTLANQGLGSPEGKKFRQHLVFLRLSPCIRNWETESA
jgi:hypothetical protein